MAYKPGPYGVPQHMMFPDMVNAGVQISDTEITIQSAAKHADQPAGTVLAQTCTGSVEPCDRRRIEGNKRDS